MKHLKTFKLFENQNSIEMGDKVLILFKVPGTDKRELVPVQIVRKINNSNSYEVTFKVENNPFQNQKNMVVKSSKIVGPYHAIREPLSPNYISQQPVPTDYNSPGNIGAGGVSNDVVLPNS